MLQKVKFAPGFNKQVTSTGGESQWVDGDNVRFRYGTPEKIGGWTQLGADNITGAARALHQFTNSEGRKYSIIGSNRILYAYSGGVFYDIHPIKSTNTLTIGGPLIATSKSFDIKHPTKKGQRLRYGSLEGPENGVYVRGRANSTKINLPDYWTGLVDEESITVNLTPIGKHQKLYVEDISNNTITIGNDNLIKKEINCFYTVYAERKDINKITVEYKR